MTINEKNISRLETLIEEDLLKNDNQLLKELIVELDNKIYDSEFASLIYLLIIKQHESSLTYSGKVSQQEQHQIEQLGSINVILLLQISPYINDNINTLLLNLISSEIINNDDALIELFNNIVNERETNKCLEEFVKHKNNINYHDESKRIYNEEPKLTSIPTEIGLTLLGFSLTNENVILFLSILKEYLNIMNENKEMVSTREKICSTLLLYECFDEMNKEEEALISEELFEPTLKDVCNNENVLAEIFDVIIDWYSDFIKINEASSHTQNSISELYIYSLCNLCIKAIPIFTHSTIILTQKALHLLNLLSESIYELKQDIKLEFSSLEMYYMALELKSSYDIYIESASSSDIRFLILHNILLMNQMFSKRNRTENCKSDEEAEQQFNNAILNQVKHKIYHVESSINNNIQDILHAELQKYALIKEEEFHFSALVVGYITIQETEEAKSNIYIEISDDNIDIIYNIINSIYGKSWKIIYIIYKYTMLFLTVELSNQQSEYEKESTQTKHYIDYHKYIRLINNLLHYKQQYISEYLIIKNIYESVIENIIYNLCVNIYKSMELNLRFSTPIYSYLDVLEQIIELCNKNDINVKELLISEYLGYNIGNYMFILILAIESESKNIISSAISLLEQIINELKLYNGSMVTYKFFGYFDLHQSKQKEISMITISETESTRYQHLEYLIEYHINNLYENIENYNGYTILSSEVFNQLIQGLKYKLLNPETCQKISINTMQSIEDRMVKEKDSNIFILVLTSFLLDFSSFVEPEINKVILNKLCRYYTENNLEFNNIVFIFQSFSIENYILEGKYEFQHQHNIDSNLLQIFEFLYLNNQNETLIELISSINFELVLHFEQFTNLCNANGKFIPVFLCALEQPCIYDLLYVPHVFDNIINILNRNIIDVNELLLPIGEYIKNLCELKHLIESEHLNKIEEHIEMIFEILCARLSQNTHGREYNDDKEILFHEWTPEEIYLNILYLYDAEIRIYGDVQIKISKIKFEYHIMQLIDIFLKAIPIYELEMATENKLLEVSLSCISHVSSESTMKFFQTEVHPRLVVVVAKIFESEQTYECYEIILEEIMETQIQNNKIEEQCYRSLIIACLSILDFQWVKFISLRTNTLNKCEENCMDKCIQNTLEVNYQPSKFLPLHPTINNKNQYMRNLNEYEYIANVQKESNDEKRSQDFETNSFNFLEEIIPKLVNNTLYKSVHLVEHIHLIQSQKVCEHENQNYDVITGFIQCFTTQEMIDICERCITYSSATLVNCYPYLTNVYNKLIKETDCSLHLLSITLNQIFEIESPNDINTILGGSIELISREPEYFYNHVEKYLLESPDSINKVFSTFELLQAEHTVFRTFIDKYISDLQDVVLMSLDNDEQAVIEEKYDLYILEWNTLSNEIISNQEYRFNFVTIIEENNRLEQFELIALYILFRNVLFLDETLNYELINNILKFEGMEEININCESEQNITDIFVYESTKSIIKEIIESNSLDIDYMIDALEEEINYETNKNRRYLAIFIYCLVLMINISSYRVEVHNNLILKIINEYNNQNSTHKFFLLLIVDYTTKLMKHFNTEMINESYSNTFSELYEVIITLYLNNVFILIEAENYDVLNDMLNILLKTYDIMTENEEISELRPIIAHISLECIKEILESDEEVPETVQVELLESIITFIDDENAELEQFFDNNLHNFILQPHLYNYIQKIIAKIEESNPKTNENDTNTIEHEIETYLKSHEICENVCKNLISRLKYNEIILGNEFIQLFTILIRCAKDTGLELLTRLETLGHVELVDNILCELTEYDNIT